MMDANDRIAHLEDGLTAVQSEVADVRVEVERGRSEMAMMKSRLIKWHQICVFTMALAFGEGHPTPIGRLRTSSQVSQP